MPEIESLVRDARPDWPEPPGAVEDTILRSLGLAEAGVAPRSWLRRLSRSRRTRLIAVAALLAGSGAALAVALTGRSGPAPGGAPASLAFSAPESVGTAGGYGESGAGVAVDAAGEVTVAWSRAGRIVVATRARAGGWSAPQRLSDPARRAAQPQVAAGPAGRVVVVWRERLPGRAVAEDFRLPGGAPGGTLESQVGVRWAVMARSRAADGAWSAPEAVSPSTAALRDVYRPRLVMTASGEALVGYVEGGRAWVARQAPGGPWGMPVAISGATGRPSDLDLVVDPASGWSLATWSTRVEDPRLGRRWGTWAALRPPRGAWAAAEELGAPGAGKHITSAAIGGAGAAVVAWAERDAMAVTRDAGTAWSKPATVVASPRPGAQAFSPPAVAVDGDGRAFLSASFGLLVASASASRATPPPTVTVRRAPGGDWGPAVSLGGFAVTAAAVPDLAGGIVVAWAGPGAPMATHLEAFAADGASRARVRLGAGGFSMRIATGADGTTALLRLRTAADGQALVVAVAPGRGRP